jgi:hypothetical protein
MRLAELVNLSPKKMIKFFFLLNRRNSRVGVRGSFGPEAVGVGPRPAWVKDAPGQAASFIQARRGPTPPPWGPNVPRIPTREFRLFSEKKLFFHKNALFGQI